MTPMAPWPEGGCPSRRELLRSLSAVGVTTLAGGLLAGCGADPDPNAAGAFATSGTTASGTSADGGPTTNSSAGTGSATTGSATTGSATTGSATTGSPATVVAPASAVTVGHALVVEAGGQRIVVAQPMAGTFVAFSTRCTHQGTPVNVLDGLELACPNHGSRFSAADGSVSRGPAASPLAAVGVRLEGDQVVLS